MAALLLRQISANYVRNAQYTFLFLNRCYSYNARWYQPMNVCKLIFSAILLNNKSKRNFFRVARESINSQALFFPQSSRVLPLETIWQNNWFFLVKSSQIASVPSLRPVSFVTCGVSSGQFAELCLQTFTCQVFTHQVVVDLFCGLHPSSFTCRVVEPLWTCFVDMNPPSWPFVAFSINQSIKQTNNPLHHPFLFNPKLRRSQRWVFGISVSSAASLERRSLITSQAAAKLYLLFGRVLCMVARAITPSSWSILIIARTWLAYVTMPYNYANFFATILILA